MKAKLTLTVEREAMAKAKRLAGKQGVSVSALFERWSLAMSEAEERRAPLGSRLRGRWKSGAGAKEDPRLEFLFEKHGGR